MNAVDWVPLTELKKQTFEVKMSLKNILHKIW